MKLTKTILAALSLSLAGCTGSLDTGGGGGGGGPGPGGGGGLPGETPKEMFELNVQADVVQRCGAAGGCHAAAQPGVPAFIAQDSTQVYDTLIANSTALFPNFIANSAPLLTYPAMAHYGADWTADQRNAIETWLAAEAAAPDDNTGNASALQVFSGCMDLQEWADTDVNDRFADADSDDGNCEACHNLGADRFYANDRDAESFSQVAYSAVRLQYYFTLDADDPTKVIPNHARMLRALEDLPGHPAFDDNNDNYLGSLPYQALENYYSLTMTRMQNGQCEDPKF